MKCESAIICGCCCSGGWFRQLVGEFGRVRERKKLRVNLSKSKVMKCSRLVDERRMNVALNGTMLEEVKCFKYLRTSEAILTTPCVRFCFDEVYTTTARLSTKWCCSPKYRRAPRCDHSTNATACKITGAGWNRLDNCRKKRSCDRPFTVYMVAYPYLIIKLFFTQWCMIHTLLTAAGCTLPVLPDDSHENRLQIPLISLQISRTRYQSATDPTLRTAALDYYLIVLMLCILQELLLWSSGNCLFYYTLFWCYSLLLHLCLKVIILHFLICLCLETLKLQVETL